jgi:hydroxymethylglutaryl-CoA reductase (NADPH)
MTATQGQRSPVPRMEDDYSRAAAAKRMEFIRAATGVHPEHIGQYSLDPAVVAGNIENFIGAAQVPIGIAARC